MKNNLEYAVHVKWTGNSGSGTSAYDAYGRDYEIEGGGKPILSGSADPHFRGADDKYNPEEYLLVAASACHMLTYLALCARQGISVLDYEDAPTANLNLKSHSIEQIVLNPKMKIKDPSHLEKAKSLHAEANRQCFIANSCKFPIEHNVSLTAEGD